MPSSWSPSGRAIRCLFVALGLVVLGSGTAFAAEPTFESLIGEAKTAYDAEEFEVAVEKLLAANRLQPNSRLLLNVARSYGKAGDCAKSIAYYRAFINAPDAEAGLVKTATSEEGDVKCDTYDDAYSGRVLFESTPSGATVTMGDLTLGTTPFETVQIPSGTQTFTFALEGHDSVEKEAKLLAERQVEISATLQETVVEVEPEPEPEPVAAVVVPKKEEINPMYYVAGGITGVGVGLLIVGAVYDLSVIPGTDDERAKYERDSAKWQELTDQRSTEASIALISYASGAVLAIGGGAWLGYLLMTESDEPAAEAGSVQIFPVVGRDNAGVGVMGRF